MNLIDKNELDKLVEEPFEKFLSRLNLNCPESVEAIPVKWIEKFRNQFDEADDFYNLLDTMLTIWERCKEENDG